MKYTDIHTHVNLAAFAEDYKEVIGRAHEADVALITVGTQKDTSMRAVEIAREYEEGVYATVGIHPVHTDKSFHDKKELGGEGSEFTSRGEVFDYDFYKELASDPKVVAIGECGLDYYRTEPESLEKQRDAFSAQIALANELQKPLMLHIRTGDEANAYQDAYEIIKTEAKVPGNVHFFAGTLEDAKQFWDIGYSTSFTGVITFTHDYDEVAKAAPKDLIHGETDAPYVAPVPHRGKRNEPAYVIETIKRMADIRSVSFEEMAEQLRENTQRFFKIS